MWLEKYLWIEEVPVLCYFEKYLESQWASYWGPGDRTSLSFEVLVIARYSVEAKGGSRAKMEPSSRVKLRAIWTSESES